MPDRKFGGRQEGAGRKELPPELRQHPLTIFVSFETLQCLRSLPRAERVALQREAAAALENALKSEPEKSVEK